MAKFLIQMSWLMIATVQIEADSKEEAEQKVHDQPLPLSQGYYAKPSIDVEDIEEINDTDSN